MTDSFDRNDPANTTGAGAPQAAAVGPRAAGLGAAVDPATGPRVLLVYTTNTGTTRAMADSVAEGVRSVEGAVVEVHELVVGREVDRETVPDFDALILGTSLRHRQMHHVVKLFIEDVLEALWLTDGMVGMVGATFSVGGGHGDVGAGADLCQVGMLSSMAANGMILVPLPKTTPGFDHAGLHWGPAGRTGGPKMEPIRLTQEALDVGFHHGANVARVAATVAPRRGTLFARGNQSPSPEVLAGFTAGPSPFVGDPAPRGSNPLGRGDVGEGFPSGDGFEVTHD